MLDRLHSGLFSPYLGKPCRLECGEVGIEVVLDSVVEKPHACHPYAPEGTRMPFVLILKGSPDCPYGDGTFTLKIPGMDDIPGIYLNRIMNIDPVPASVFQAVFN